jgi:hypothetical protein
MRADFCFASSSASWLFPRLLFWHSIFLSRRSIHQGRAKLDRVIALLESSSTTPTTTTNTAKTKKGGHVWTQAERDAMSKKQLARWAAKKKKAKMKPIWSDKKRKLPESPMEWSKCPVCGESFSEQHPGPIPGTTTYIHPNGTKHIK